MTNRVFMEVIPAQIMAGMNISTKPTTAPGAAAAYSFRPQSLKYH